MSQSEQTRSVGDSRTENYGTLPKLLIWILLPGFMLAWATRPLIAQRAFFWRRTGASRVLRAGLVAGLLVLVAVEARSSFQVSSWVANAGWQWLLGFAIGFQVLVGFAIAWFLLPWQWSKLSRGLIESGKEMGIKAAGWAAALSDSRHALKRATAAFKLQKRYRCRSIPVSYLGVRIVDDRRPFISRNLDKTKELPSAWFPIKSVSALPMKPPRVLMLAESGHGKTQALFSLVLAALRLNQRAVFFDLKGSLEDAYDLKKIAEDLGKRVVVWPEDHIDLWKCSAAQQLSILMRLLPKHEYWSAKSQNVLNALLKEGPFTSTADIYARLSNPAKYVTDASELATITQRTQGIPSTLHVLEAIRAQLDVVAPLIDGGSGSWAFDNEEIDLIIVSADTGSDSRLLRAVSAMIADLNAYRVARRDIHTAKPMMWFFDESQIVLQAADAPDLAWICEQCRSQNVGIVVATQSVDALGPTAGRFLGAGMTLWVGRNSDPDQLVHRAGTILVPERAWDQQGRSFKASSTRTQHVHRLDPNIVRSLPVGAWAIVESGRVGFTLLEQPNRIADVNARF